MPPESGRQGDPIAYTDGMDDTPTIRLDDVLKLAGIAATGGQAKHLIQAGQVKVNGAVETRRKHLLRAGDEVAVGDEVFVVELDSQAGGEGDGRDGGQPGSGPA